MGILTNFIDRLIISKNAALEGAKQGAKEALQNFDKYKRAEMERKQKVRDQMQANNRKFEN